MDCALTFQCNNDCISCIFDTRQMRLMPDPSQKELEEQISRSEEAQYMGFTGGEPTLLEDLAGLLSFARGKWPQKEIFLVSNGRKFADKEYAKKFLGLGNFRIGIPIYSHKRQKHDKITRAAGSWAETIEGIKNLVEFGLKVELRVIVNRENFRELEKTAEFISKNLKGVARIVFINMKYTGNAFIYRKKLFVRYSAAAPFVEKAAGVLAENGFEVRLFHFPHCVIGRKYWPMSAGVTKQEEELTFSKNCTACSVKGLCSRIWISYLPLAGEEEFKAVR
ncbi:MAG: radical SAM protein [Candidatus Diapherotrites archaeon]|nr:radical SAM protein [Candidatus Diapherotrites archaeon]